VGVMPDSIQKRRGQLLVAEAFMMPPS
jgi:hypothetical protein